jgi:hypothetical protein
VSGLNNSTEVVVAYGERDGSGYIESKFARTTLIVTTNN